MCRVKLQTLLLGKEFKSLFVNFSLLSICLAILWCKSQPKIGKISYVEYIAPYRCLFFLGLAPSFPEMAQVLTITLWGSYYFPFLQSNKLKHAVFKSFACVNTSKTIVFKFRFLWFSQGPQASNHSILQFNVPEQ